MILQRLTEASNVKSLAQSLAQEVQLPFTFMTSSTSASSAKLECDKYQKKNPQGSRERGQLEQSLKNNGISVF